MRVLARSIRARRPASVAAMMVVVLVAIFQSAVIALLIGAQRDAAHVIDISGAQRMRSQELAYLALSLTTGRPDAGAAAETERVIAAMDRTRAELRREPIYDTGPRDRDGRTALGRFADRFVSEVRAVERNPRGAEAIDAVRRDREAIRRAFDAAVEKRVGIVNARNDRLIAALLLGLLVQIACIAAVWFGIIIVSERRNVRLLARLQSARAEIESTFAQNPDGIAVYDGRGVLVRVNAARAAMFGRPAEELVGKHFCELIAAADVERTRAAFARATAGEAVRGDVRLRTQAGAAVEVAVSIFPRVVDGVTDGVNVVSKDQTKLRAAEAENAEQMRRLTDLYDIASAYGRTTDELLDSAIALVAARLGYDFGAITEIVDDLVTVIATCGDPTGLMVGSVQPLRTSLAQLALVAPDAYEARDFHATPYATPSARDLGWTSVAGMKIYVGGTIYGTVGFASRAMRAAELSEADKSFMRIACALLGTIIERGRQLRKLDALAYFDSLTGLPNRVQFTKRLQSAVQRGEPFAVHYVDLDHFKRVNDVHGHSAGDRVLEIAAKRLEHCARGGDMVVRLGGDEFAVLQAGPIDRERAAAFAERLVDAFARPIVLGGRDHDVGTSVGVAVFPADGVDPSGLIDAADEALYRAKHAGRRCVAFASDRHARSIA